MSLMELRRTRTIASKRRTRGNANDSAGSDSMRAQTSSNSKDKSPNYVEEDEVASEGQFPIVAMYKMNPSPLAFS